MFLRHAKSERNTGTKNDLIRPLSSRGRAAAAAVGRFLAGIGQVPNLVLCSPAIRARHTLDIAVAAGNWTCPSEIVNELYYGTLEDLVKLACRRQVPLVMIIGHEPVISSALEYLTGAEVRMPTGTLSRVELGPDSAASLDWLIPPRLLTDC